MYHLNAMYCPQATCCFPGCFPVDLLLGQYPMYPSTSPMYPYASISLVIIYPIYPKPEPVYIPTYQA